MNKGKVILLFFVLSALLLNAEEKRVITKNNIHLRQGPGCYFPLVNILNIGDSVAVITEQKNWAQVTFNDTTGWICGNCFSKKEYKTSFPSEKLLKSETTNISKITAGGAVKGFAVKSSGYDHSLSEKVILKSYLDVAYYKTFKQSMEPHSIHTKKYERLIKTPPRSVHIDHRLEGIGDLVARKIAAKGLVTDKQQMAYLNAIGTLVLEETPLYYVPMKFFIIKDNNKAAYATPNGMVFITQGLIELLQNEAELATLLAHEIAHIVYQHGYKELENRKTIITAESAFAQLDAETAMDKSESQEELEDLAGKFYENATALRQMDYEYEADKMGVLFAAAAGYDPTAFTALLHRLKSETTIDYENFESNWEKYYIKDRLEKVSEFIKDNLTRNPIQKASRFHNNLK